MMHKSLRHLRSRYGITPDVYLQLYNMQRGVCIGCKQSPKGGGRSNANSRLFIDHDHKTGSIRGLLCQGCNAAIGLVYDNPETLRGLASYLERKPVYYSSDFPVKDRGSSERSKTHCKAGHEYVDSNTYRTTQGWRQCIICRKRNDKNRRCKKSVSGANGSVLVTEIT